MSDEKDLDEAILLAALPGTCIVFVKRKKQKDENLKNILKVYIYIYILYILPLSKTYDGAFANSYNA